MEPTLRELSITNNVLTEVGKERIQQHRKWGEQNHCPWRWLAILGEEAGEANKAVLESSRINPETKRLEFPSITPLKEGKGCYREELIQVAAVAVAMVECLDRGEWVTR